MELVAQVSSYCGNNPSIKLHLSLRKPFNDSTYPFIAVCQIQFFFLTSLLMTFSQKILPVCVLIHLTALTHNAAPPVDPILALTLLSFHSLHIGHNGFKNLKKQYFILQFIARNMKLCKQLMNEFQEFCSIFSRGNSN